MREARVVPPFFCPQRGRALPTDLLRRLPWSSDPGAPASRRVPASRSPPCQVWAAAGGRITDVNLLLGSP